MNSLCDHTIIHVITEEALNIHVSCLQRINCLCVIIKTLTEASQINNFWSTFTLTVIPVACTC